MSKAPASQAPNDPRRVIPFKPSSIDQVLNVFDRWLLLVDSTPIYAALGTVAANMLDGDPVWLGLIGPPSSAKTEILNSTSRLPDVIQAATLTPASLLSGTAKKDFDKNAKGGLLRQIGKFGILVMKDFGSILSMRPDTKAETLAALREVYDGHWTRHLGTDGGKTLSWEGKVGLLFGSTGVIDSHYSVGLEMGDRFLLSRFSPTNEGQFVRALDHRGGDTRKMRTEIAEAVAGLFAGKRQEPRPIDDAEIQELDDLLSVVIRLRGPVVRDRQSREIENVPGHEGPARIGLALERLLAGLDTLGVDRDLAFTVVKAVAMDSVPPQRRKVYEYLCSRQTLAGEYRTEETGEVAEALELPTTTIRRVLEDLTAYRLVYRARGGHGKADSWSASPPKLEREKA